MACGAFSCEDADVAGQLADRLEEVFGQRDPRLSQWGELCAEVGD